MSETGNELRQVIAQPNFKELPADSNLSFGAVRKLFTAFAGLTNSEREMVGKFVRKASEGPRDGSLGLFGKGDAKTTFDLLKEKAPTRVLQEIDQALEGGGFNVRFPKAVVKALEQNNTPFPGFETVSIDVSSDDRRSICPDGEANLLIALQGARVTIITLDKEPFMMGKFTGADGKDLAVCLKSMGPFVKGVLYSPQGIAEDQREIIRENLRNEGNGFIPFNLFGNNWILERPIWGIPEDQRKSYFVSYRTSPKQEIAEEFTRFLVDNSKSYNPRKIRKSAEEADHLFPGK